MHLYRPLIFKNSTVCVTVKSPLEVGSVDDVAAGGAAFWAVDYQNYYVAEIYLNGTFAVFRRIEGNWVVVVPRSASDAIRKGVGRVNELQVVLNNTDGVLYINGTQVRDFRGQPPQNGGATGLFAQAENHQANDWRFLKITVVENQ